MSDLEQVHSKIFRKYPNVWKEKNFVEGIVKIVALFFKIFIVKLFDKQNTDNFSLEFEQGTMFIMSPYRALLFFKEALIFSITGVQ